MEEFGRPYLFERACNNFRTDIFIVHLLHVFVDTCACRLVYVGPHVPLHGYLNEGSMQLYAKMCIHIHIYIYLYVYELVFPVLKLRSVVTGATQHTCTFRFPLDD